MSVLDAVLAFVGALVLVTALVSVTLKRLPFSTPLLAFTMGIAFGPVGLGVLQPATWSDERALMEHVARLTLGIGLMAVALRVPTDLPLRDWKPVAVLLGVVMPLMWLATGAVVHLTLGLPLLAALLVGAILTPTDPVTASAIVLGGPAERNLPERLRRLITGESGANDGLAYLFLLLPALLLALPADAALAEWLGRVLLREVIGGTLLGAALGALAGWLLERAERHGTVETYSFLSYSLALSLLVLGGVHLLGSEGILAVFVAGVVFNRIVKGSERAEEERVQEAVNRFFVLPAFALLGAIAPWHEWLAMGWTAVAVVLGVLLARRLPALLLVSRNLGNRHPLPDALFLGWFGPIGVAALFYAAHAHRLTHIEEAWTVGTLVVAASLLFHGVTATPLTRLYGRWTGRADAPR